MKQNVNIRLWNKFICEDKIHFEINFRQQWLIISFVSTC